MADLDISEKNLNRLIERWLWTSDRQTKRGVNRRILRLSLRDGAAAARNFVDTDAILALDKQLSDKDFGYLRWQYTKSVANRDDMAEFLDLGPEQGALVRDKGFQLWCIRVANSEVVVKAGGRAIVRQPDTRHAVEFQWVYNKKTHVVKSLHVVADGEIVVGEIGSLDEYMVAFKFRVHRGEVARSRAPRTRPAPGVPLDPDFYRRLLEAYDSLVADGLHAPAKTLALRMGENPGTVKSWLSRGRKYLEEGN